MAALRYLKPMYALSDEETVERWCIVQITGESYRLKDKRKAGQALARKEPKEQPA